VAAAIIGYGATGATKDIDTWKNVPPTVEEARRKFLVRAYEHDLEAIEQMHLHRRLDRRKIVKRFEEEMGGAVADQAKLRLNVAMLVERLFGHDEGRKLAERWEVPVPTATKKRRS
jgi:hypothetical protein